MVVNLYRERRRPLRQMYFFGAPQATAAFPIRQACPRIPILECG